MTVPALRIYDAICEVVEGTIGESSVRVPLGTFKRGTFEGQQATAKQAAVLDGTHGFDVQMRGPSDHPATPVSALTTQPIQSFEVVIPIWTHVKSTAEGRERFETLAQIIADGDRACTALGYPHNLDTTQAGGDTNIVGGLMFGPGALKTPDFAIVEENWDAHWVRSQIIGSLIVSPGA
jgi:hypothetical protein